LFAVELLAGFIDSIAGGLWVTDVISSDKSSLNKAITSGKLLPPDQILVRSMWENLY
jgi:hypothetical protein